MTACDPATLRALAARVMAREATNDLRVEIALAVGWTLDGAPYDRFWIPPGGSKSDWQIGPPRLLTSLDAAAALFAPLRERGWEMDVNIRSGRAYAAAWHGNIDLTEIIDGAAPDEPAARVALALLCLAAEGEATP